MELVIGSNILKNTSGVLKVQGKEQIYLEIGATDKQLLLTMDIYDANGKHVAKLRRNAWVFNDKNKYEITTDPNMLKLIDKDSGVAVVIASVADTSKIEISQGNFYTHTGQLLEITPQYWRIGGLTMSGNVFDSCGGAVAIG